MQRRPQWGARWPRHEQVTLAPLTGAGGSALASALTSRFAAPVPALEARLSDLAAGNPFYMEALLQMLVDTGVIDTRGEHWQLHDERLRNLVIQDLMKLQQGV